MASYKELVSAWEKAGRPRDTDSIHDILMNAGLQHEQAVTAFEAAGLQAPAHSEPEVTPEQSTEPTIDQPEPWIDVEIPIDYTITSNTGKEFTWKGAQWVSKGKIVPKEYKEKVTHAAKKQYYNEQQNAADDARRAQEEAKRMKDSEHEFENIESSSQAAKQQANLANDPKANNTASHSDDYIAKLAQMVKQHPNSKKLADIIFSSTADDKAARLAATIVAQNKQADAVAVFAQRTDR